MKYKAILFDLDFTLYDECQFFNAAVISSRIFDNAQDVISKITYRLRINSDNIINDLLNLEDKLNEKNKNHLFSIMKKMDLKFECYRGIKEMLSEFKTNISTKTAIVTNGVPEIQKNKLQQLDIENCLDQVIFAKELNSEKPNHFPFEEALSQLSVNAETTLFVGDHPVNDIKPANELGMDTLWIDHLDKNNIVSTYRITDANNLSDTIAYL